MGRGGFGGGVDSLIQKVFECQYQTFEYQQDFGGEQFQRIEQREPRQTWQGDWHHLWQEGGLQRTSRGE
jgi:hypothetical protein